MSKTPKRYQQLRKKIENFFINIYDKINIKNYIVVAKLN